MPLSDHAERRDEQAKRGRYNGQQQEIVFNKGEGFLHRQSYSQRIVPVGRPSHFANRAIA